MAWTYISLDGKYWTADRVDGKQAVQCRFPADVPSDEVSPFYRMRIHRFCAIYGGKSHSRRHLCEPAGILANRMGTSAGTTHLLFFFFFYFPINHSPQSA